MIKKSKNWKKLFQQLGLGGNQQNDTISSLKKEGVMQKIAVIQKFVGEAKEEYKLENKLNKDILDKLKGIKLALGEHKVTGSALISGVDEIQTTLDDFLSTLMMMKQSQFAKPIMQRVRGVERRLIGMQDLLEEWLLCQRTWIYLHPIFLSEDLKKKMPVEKKMFDSVDEIWLQIMKNTSNDPSLFENFDWEKVLAEFQKCNEMLGKVKKSLSEYLEAKRDDFSRFYFLSDEELIEILSKTKNPKTVIKYLNKCFEGIDSIEFGRDNEITSMISSKGERILLTRPIYVDEGEKKGNVEKWLSELEDVMRETVRQRVKEAAKETNKDRLAWIKKWPSQVVLAVNQVVWTNESEEAINQCQLAEFSKKMAGELSQVVDRVRQPLDYLERLNLSVLIVIDVHAKYVIDELVAKGVGRASDFEWLSQLRSYLNKRNLLQLNIMTSSYDYQYEYLGNSGRLVITPLTDRCYRTLIGAYQFCYGGAPEGPAGTGKTETVKDLAKAVAV